MTNPLGNTNPITLFSWVALAAVLSLAPACAPDGAREESEATEIAMADPIISTPPSIPAPAIPSDAAEPPTEDPAPPTRENLGLVVTDSGLGGLSVVADIARRAQEAKLYRKVEITFVNALFRPQAGYNSLSTRGEKVAIFDNALQAMKERYSPDAILVACNTLSVLLPDCPATRDSITEVRGIVQTGVDLIAEELEKNPGAAAILFATQTTVEEDTHRQALLARGIAPERLVLQPCPELTWYIEQDPEGFETELLISTFVTEALGKRGDSDAAVAMSFNCTHFGYSERLWREEMEAQGAILSATLNPNDRMADFLFPEDAAARFEEAEVSIRVVSMVEIEEQTVRALAPVLGKISEAAASALREWELVPGLFEWENAIKN